MFPCTPAGYSLAGTELDPVDHMRAHQTEQDGGVERHTHQCVDDSAGWWCCADGGSDA